MLPLSASGDFSKIENAVITNPYIDINAKDSQSVVYGAQAIDQAIENVLCTMPGELLFNFVLNSPLYEILFDNYTDGIEEQIFAKVEMFVPIVIIRKDAVVRFSASDHVLTISFPYKTRDGLISSVFTRRIGR